MIVAVDVDEILFPFISEFCRFYNEKYGTNFKREDFVSYYLWNVIGGTKQQAIDKAYEFYESPYFLNAKPIEDPRLSIGKLSPKHDLIIVTSRPDDIKDQTLEWLQRHFLDKFPEENVYFGNAYSKLGEEERSKVEMCLEHKATTLIDDSLKYAKECAANGINVVLLDCPWNQTEDNDQTLDSKIIRVGSWREILMAVDSLAE